MEKLILDIEVTLEHYNNALITEGECLAAIINHTASHREKYVTFIKGRSHYDIEELKILGELR